MKTIIVVAVLVAIAVIGVCALQQNEKSYQAGVAEAKAQAAQTILDTHDANRAKLVCVQLKGDMIQQGHGLRYQTLKLADLGYNLDCTEKAQ